MPCPGPWNHRRGRAATERIGLQTSVTIAFPRSPITLSQTCTYDGLPGFLAEYREYATRTGLGLPRGTPEQEERFKDIMTRVQALQNPGVPLGLETAGNRGN